MPGNLEEVYTRIKFQINAHQNTFLRLLDLVVGQQLHFTSHPPRGRIEVTYTSTQQQRSSTESVFFRDATIG